MNKQAVIPLAIGLVVGLGALKLGWDYLAKMQKSTHAPTGPVKKVVVAARPLSIGTFLTEDDLAVVDMPVDLVPADAVSDVKDLAGQTIKTTLAAKMPLLTHMVGAGKGFRGVIPEGYRAVTVKVDEFTGVAGLLKPGHRVDVVGTFTFRSGMDTRTVSKVVLQNVQVRAVGQEFHEEEGTSSLSSKLSRSVTLLVRPAQVERLQLAASKGKIRLALRAPFDDNTTMTQGITLAKLLSSPSDALGSGGGNGFLNKFVQLAFNKPQGTAPEAAQTTSYSRPQPYEVIVLAGGNKVERIYFESRDSDRRVSPIGFDTNDDASESTKQDADDKDEESKPSE